MMFKLWTSQVLDFDQFDEQYCYCYGTKSLKLIASEKNIIRVQQLSLCLPLFFVSFFFELLKSGIKSWFDRVIMLYLCAYFCFSWNFPMLYCCKDCKNIMLHKRQEISSEQIFWFFFQAFQVPCWFIKSFLSLGLARSISLNIIFFSEWDFSFWAQKLPS